ncbi:hypothetical protein RB653_003211 [Dictyostelium firmibasis]|uniref:Uncharacterized protein n=1 Tax=Dictyostelium firmibasis TaxID=79012 RepID=A0AAN7YW85_9MYCE
MKVTQVYILILLLVMFSFETLLVVAKESEKYDYEKLRNCIAECEDTDYILNICYQGHPKRNVAKELANVCLDYAKAYENNNQDQYLSKCYDLCKLYSHK